MEFKLNGKKFDLPVYNLEVVELIDDLKDKETEYRKKEIKASELFREYHEFATRILGDKVADATGSDDVTQADFQLTTLAVIEIVKTYNDPIIKRENEVEIENLKMQLNDPTIAKILNPSVLSALK